MGKAEPVVISERTAEDGVQVLHRLRRSATAAGPRQGSEPLLLCRAAVTEQKEGLLAGQQRPAGVADLQGGLAPPPSLAPQALCHKPDRAACQGDLHNWDYIAVFQRGLSS